VIEEPGRRPLALGTPASSLGPSAYPTGSPLVAFDSLAASGTTCSSTSVTLSTVSLFGGVVTASSVTGTAGKGTVTGLQVEGADASLGPGQVVAVGTWAQVTLERKVGRARAILVVTLIAAHGPLPAGTVIAVGFEAAPQPITKPKPTGPQGGGQAAPSANHNGPTASVSPRYASKRQQRRPQKAPPDYPVAPTPLKAGGGFTDAVQDNPVVATALQYLGVPYQWGGASPKAGFDCSGLVQYVFAQLGVPLLHYAAAQYRTPGSVWIPPDRLQAGDLVFFIGSDGTRKAPGHVGIYVADGYIIDAPHTGTLVRIDSLNEPQLANQYVGAKQIDPNLINARHLLDTTKPGTSAATFPTGLPAPIPIAPLGASLGVAAAGTAGPQEHWLWEGAALGALLLVFASGGLLVRRHRHKPDSSPSG
jgi:cell wall-associated NlpC family hydrolase